MSVEAAIRRSAATFRQQVWPHLSSPMGGGELIPVETVTESGFATLLDRLGMTDAWQVVNDRGLRALATRVQWTDRAYETWTIRSRLSTGNATEYHKLTQDGAWQLPHYIVQAYVRRDTDQLLSAAAIRTVDLQQMLRNGWHNATKRNPQDGNEFLPIPWIAAEVYGYEVIRVSAQ